MKSWLTDIYYALEKRTRPTELEYGLLLAIAAASRSTCSRAMNGAVITSHGRVLSTGYNGALSGQDHCKHECDCDNLQQTGSRDVHWNTCSSNNPCSVAVHAEHNAILWAARNGIATKDASLFSTMMPCGGCAKAIVQAGIKEVNYLLPYRSGEGALILRNAGVQVNGYTVQVEYSPPIRAGYVT